MEQLPLKVVNPPETPNIFLAAAPSPPDPYRLDRRRSERHHITGRVTAVTTPGGGADNRGRICSLQLLDISDSGMGALNQDALALETPITVFFPAHGPERGFDAWGRVVRCIPRDYGHEVGIRFEARPAA